MSKRKIWLIIGLIAAWLVVCNLEAKDKNTTSGGSFEETMEYQMVVDL